MTYRKAFLQFTLVSVAFIQFKLFGQDYKPYTEFSSKLEGLKERKTGRIIIPAKYTHVNDYYNGFLSVYNNGMGYAVIDTRVV